MSKNLGIVMEDAEGIDLLLIEDDDNHALLVTRQLKKLGSCRSVQHFKDGDSALSYLRQEEPYQNAQRPNLILLDLKLPKISGHEVLAEIKKDESLSKIPVVVLTTSKADADRRMAYEMAANSYLVKPVDFQEFKALLEDFGRYWGMWNTPPPSKKS